MTKSSLSCKAGVGKRSWEGAPVKYKNIEMSPEQFKLAYTRQHLLDRLKSDKVYNPLELQALLHDYTQEAEGFIVNRRNP
jgi:hypothetical protein